MTSFNRLPSALEDLDLSLFPKGQVSSCWVQLVSNGIGEPIRVPVVVAVGKKKGPVLGLTAAVHGNELNGISVLQQLFEEIEPDKLTGIIVGVLAVNVPGVLQRTRKFNDGVDLNDIAPGRAEGNESEVYIYRFLHRIVKRFDFMIDLHTASQGRVNSYYIRADMSDPDASVMARLQNPDIILNNIPADGTVRGEAQGWGIKAITAELRDPGVFQKDVTQGSLLGIRNVLYHYSFLEGLITCPAYKTPVCEKSYWLYSHEGGILRVLVDLNEHIKKGQTIAEVRTIFGEIKRKYQATGDGIVIGRSISPINQTGSRIIHFGSDIKELPCLTEET